MAEPQPRKKKVLEHLTELAQHVKSLVDPNSHADPTLSRDRVFFRGSVNGVMEALVDQFGYDPRQLPSNEWLRRYLNAQGYSTRKIRKSLPRKRIEATDEIFDNVFAWIQKADSSIKDEILRLSLDAKARVKVGRFSRGGSSRCQVRAWDHDFEPDAWLVPLGIFLPAYDELHIDFCRDRAPADAWVDSLEAFWQTQRHRFAHTHTLVLQLDNGPENNSHRTQFLARLVSFAQVTGLQLVLTYYPPYLSKYNPIERCWGVLEQHWGGCLLDSVQAVLGYASTMTYNGVNPFVRLVETVYHKGVRVGKKAMQQVNRHIRRHPTIGDYALTISPSPAPC